VQAWVDAQIGPNGDGIAPIDALDSMMPGQLLIDLHEETKLPRYKTAADAIRARYDTYPRTTDGGFWHTTYLEGQLWGDGTFMALPFLIRYGHAFGDAAYADDETTLQLEVYGKHLENAATGLLFHAYDEQGDAGWADPTTHDSPVSWCRAMGWYGMA